MPGPHTVNWPTVKTNRLDSDHQNNRLRASKMQTITFDMSSFCFVCVRLLTQIVKWHMIKPSSC